MNAVVLTLALVLHANDKPLAALVVDVASPPPSVAALRQRLSREAVLVEDIEVRRALEEPPPSADVGAAVAVRESLERARVLLRKFQLPAVNEALREARAASASLLPNEEGRTLTIELAVREAEAALVEGNEERALASMQWALSVSPALVLEPARYSPTLLDHLERARAKRASSKRVSLRIISYPPGATVELEGRPRGLTPMVLDNVPERSTLVWLTLSGYRARAQRVESGAPVEVTLTPLSSQAPRVLLAENLRRAPDEPTRTKAANGLRTLLPVDAVAYARGPELTWFGPRASAPQVERSWAARHWPSLVAGGAALLLAGGGLALGLDARARATRAEAEHFASDGVALSRSAQKQAVWANVLYGAAGVSAAGAAGLAVFF